ncbi:MAG: prepilin peptidase [Candidatus Nealsonbacteria bacterium]
MTSIFYLIIFIFGLVIGSFLNCVIYRLEKEHNLKGRSFCPKCKHTLKWLDLIPFFSFVFLGGKCRYCKKKISWQYPIVEIATGLIFLLIFNFEFRILNGFLISNFETIFNFETLINFCFLLIIASFLIVIFVFDLKHFIIPDKIIYSLIGITFIKNFQFSIFNFQSIFNETILNYLISGFGAGLFFLIIVLATKGKGMGIGDIKLGFFMGLFLGYPNILVALFLAFLIGAIIGVGLILMKKKKLKSEVPFGPFLITGTLIAFFWGQELINWYLNLILIT